VTDWLAYELGVADLIRHKIGPAASVEHDVRIRGQTGKSRQIDIAVRGSLFGLGDALVVVECKHRGRPVDVAGIDAFLGLVEDVRADFGLLITASGVTAAGQARADANRLRVRVIGRDDLERWSPPGTRSLMLAVPNEQQATARDALVKAGFRVRDHSESLSANESGLDAYRLADPADAGDFQERALQALRVAGVDARSIGSGVAIGGGTPAHAWIPVYPRGIDIPVRVLAVDEEELRARVAQLAAEFGVSPDDLEPRPPAGWPRDDGF
jgi:hypothetical protein